MEMSQALEANNWKVRLVFLLSMGVVASMPYGILVNSYALGALLLFGLLAVRFVAPAHKLQAGLIISFGLFYLLHAAGLLYTENINDGRWDLETKAALLLVPLLYPAFGLLNFGQRQQILNVFVGACFIGSVYCLISGASDYAKTGDISHLFYHTLSGYIGIHAIYYSLYCGFCIFILLARRFKPQNASESLFGSGSFWPLALVVYFFLFTILLSARTPLFAICGIIFTAVLYIFYKRRKLASGLSIIGLCIGILAAGVYFSPVNKERFKEVINYKNQYSTKNWGGRALRIMNWDCSMEVIAEAPIIGVGTGDVQDHLQACYTAKDYGPMLWNNAHYNSHNQYFQTWLGLGIGGVALLLVVFGVSLVWAVVRRDYLHLAFISLIIIGCVTESMLCTQKGVVFFAFFNILLAFTPARLSGKAE